MATGPADAPRTALGRAVISHLGTKDVVKVVYGSIVGLALVVALEAHPGTPTQTFAAVVATAPAASRKGTSPVADAFSTWGTGRPVRPSSFMAFWASRTAGWM